jgi:DNA-directed RNA polymerase specialized sigma24 family protein
MTENQLIKEIRDGNQKILAETYQRYRKEFVQWAYKKYNCPVEDGKELYQISFFIFYDNVISGKLEYMASHLKTYLFGIGKNKILENNRRNNRFSFDIKEEILKARRMTMKFMIKWNININKFLRDFRSWVNLVMKF